MEEATYVAPWKNRNSCFWLSSEKATASPQPSDWLGASFLALRELTPISDPDGAPFPAKPIRPSTFREWGNIAMSPWFA